MAKLLEDCGHLNEALGLLGADRCVRLGFPDLRKQDQSGQIALPRIDMASWSGQLLN
jgi:hypothetical protein